MPSGEHAIMPNRCRLSLFVVAVACLSAVAGPAWGDEASDREADRILQATKATADKPTDVPGKLMTMAQEASDSALRVALWQRSHDEGVRLKQYNVAVEAAWKMMSARRAEREAWLAKLVNACQRITTQGSRAKKEAAEETLTSLGKWADQSLSRGRCEEAVKILTQASILARRARSTQISRISDCLGRAKADFLLAQTIKRHKTRLAVNAKDRLARKALIQAYLMDLDDPAAAQRYVDETTDDVWRTYIPLAAKKPESVPEAACLELGNWYKTLAAKAKDAAKIKMLRRAKAYHRRFLSLHAKTDSQKMQIKLSLEQTTKQLRILEAPPQGHWKWFEHLGRAIRDKKYSHTKAIGAEMNRPFEDVPPKGAVLVGLRITWYNPTRLEDPTRPRGQTVIRSVQPVYLSQSGPILGKVYGRPEGKPKAMLARPGYAVGGLVGTEHHPKGGVAPKEIQLVFMKIGKTELVRSRQYASKQYPRGWRSGPVRKVGGSGRFVVGIAGVAGDTIRSLALVVLDPPEEEAPPK
jgi:hypothetical protein